MGIFDWITGASGYDDAARITRKATNQATAATREGADRAISYYEPYTRTGEDALNKLAIYSGLRGSAAQKEAYDDYIESPEVGFFRDQGEQAISRATNAAGHDALSGRTLTDLNKFNSGLATQNFGEHIGRITGLKDTGFGAAAGSAGIRAGEGANVANIIQSGGQSQAEIAAQRGMAGPNFINSLVGAGSNLLGRWAEGGFANPLDKFRTSTSSYSRPRTSSYGGPR